MEPSTSTNGTDSQAQERLRLGALVRSDSLPKLLAFASSIPAFAPFLKDIIRIGVVLDAQIVQQELRWRVGRRKKTEARTGLHEAIASEVIIPFAQTFLDSEIQEHLADIANAASVEIEDVQREWQEFRQWLHFYSPNQQPALSAAEIVDPDDLAYIAVAEELGLPIYSQDHHYQQMQAPLISVLIDGTAKHTRDRAVCA